METPRDAPPPRPVEIAVRRQSAGEADLDEVAERLGARRLPAEVTARVPGQVELRAGIVAGRRARREEMLQRAGTARDLRHRRHIVGTGEPGVGIAPFLPALLPIVPDAVGGGVEDRSLRPVPDGIDEHRNGIVGIEGRTVEKVRQDPRPLEDRSGANAGCDVRPVERRMRDAAGGHAFAQEVGEGVLRPPPGMYRPAYHCASNRGWGSAPVAAPRSQ